MSRKHSKQPRAEAKESQRDAENELQQQMQPPRAADSAAAAGDDSIDNGNANRAGNSVDKGKSANDTNKPGAHSHSTVGSIDDV